MTSVITPAEVNQENKDRDDTTTTVDREKICPLLLRVFVSTKRPHKVSEYSRGNTPPNELQIYTWMDASLEELANLVKEINSEARKKGTQFVFRLVYPDPRSPTFRFREIGSYVSGTKGPDDRKTLASVRFQIGDFVDIHVITQSLRTSGTMLDRSLDRSNDGGRNSGGFRSGGNRSFSDRSGGGGGDMNRDHRNRNDDQDGGRRYRPY